MVALVGKLWKEVWLSRSLTLKSVLVCPLKVTLSIHVLQGLLLRISLAISRRMATDKGGQQGPRSSRDPPSHQTPNDRYRQPPRDDRNNNQQNNNSIGVGPAVPGFGFNLPQMPNGFQLPPNFMFPNTAPAPGQPPPPGAS